MNHVSLGMVSVWTFCLRIFNFVFLFFFWGGGGGVYRLVCRGSNIDCNLAIEETAHKR